MGELFGPTHVANLRISVLKHPFWGLKRLFDRGTMENQWIWWPNPWRILHTQQEPKFAG